jgi:hypothetical protein
MLHPFTKNITLFLLFVFSSSIQPLNNEIDTLYQSANGRLSQPGAASLRTHFVKHTEPCQRIFLVAGWVWRCLHKDGFAVYNCFRKCRGTIEAANLFLGLTNNEDCDSFILVNGKRQKVCYPRQAADIVRDRGPVTAIEIVGGWP